MPADPVCSAFRDVGIYADLCEECFREEYKGIAEPVDEPYPKPPVDLDAPHPDANLSLKFKTVFTEDPMDTLRGSDLPPKKDQ